MRKAIANISCVSESYGRTVEQEKKCCTPRIVDLALAAS